jgi:integration host factor subunit beta
MSVKTDETSITLTKKDVARRVAKLQGEPIYKSEPWVNAVIQSIRELMEEADPEVRIELRDFGVFEVKKTKAKPKARNPKTNETVFIPSRRKTHFKPSKRLKTALQVPLKELGYSLPEGSADAVNAANGHMSGANGRKSGTNGQKNGTNGHKRGKKTA